MNLPNKRIALIGCGMIGREHLRAWEAVAEAVPRTFEIVAVCDSDPELATRARTQVAAWQVTKPIVFTSIQNLLNGVMIDGLDVCLPVYLHQSTACTALNRGINVLVEKPLAQSVAAAREMIGTAEANGCVLSLAENHRRSISIRTAHWLLWDRAEIGVPEIFHAQRIRYQDPRPQEWHWRTCRRMGGGGWAIDNGAHFLDTMRYLFGPVETVSAVAKRTTDQPLFYKGQPSGVDQREDLLAGLLRFTNGMTGVFSSASHLPGNDVFHFSIQGTEGSIVDDGGQLFHAPLPTAIVRDQGGAVRQLKEYEDDFLGSLSAGERERLFPFGLQGDFSVECGEFLRAISSEEPVEIGGQSALETLATSLAFYESAVSGTAVSVADVLAGIVNSYQQSLDEATSTLPYDFGNYRTRWSAHG
jgi:predicted dehydrogenase